MLARRLTPENQAELLSAAAGLGKQDVEHLLARWFPQPDVAALVRRIPATRIDDRDETKGGATSVIGDTPAGEGRLIPSCSIADSSIPPSTTLATPTRAPLVRPLAPERYEIRFTASGETRRKLREAQDLLGHAVPGGDIAGVIDRALTALVAELKRRKCAATSRPRPAPLSRASVKRAVWSRDAGRCAFLARDGRRCGATRRIEFHHVHPQAVGGEWTVDNIQLRCQAHNGHEVDRFFGPGVRRLGGGRMATEGVDLERLPTLDAHAAGVGCRSGTSSGTRRAVPRTDAPLK